MCYVHNHSFVDLSCLCFRLTICNRIALLKVQRDGVDAVALIYWVSIPLPFENMAQMAATVRTHDLGPLHAERPISMSRHSTWHSVEERRPATSRLEFLVRPVQWCTASGTSVGALGWIVLVVFAAEGSLSSLLANDSELICRLVSVLLP